MATLSVLDQGWARANADGSLDEAFLANLTAGQVRAYYGASGFALQSDGKIVVVGDSLETAASQGVARLDADGHLDTNFAVQVSLSVGAFPGAAVAVQSDDKILVGGNLNAVNGVPRHGLARLNRDGSLDSEFAPVVLGGFFTTPGVRALIVQPDGRILIGGDFASVNGLPRRNLARLNPDGSLDMGFQVGEGADGVVNSLLLQPDGRLVVGGAFAHLTGTRRNVVGRLNADGSIDPSFAPHLAPFNAVLNLGLQADGAVLLGGQFCQFPLDTYDCEEDWDCDTSTCLGTIRLLANASLRFVRVRTHSPEPVQLWLQATVGRTYAIESSADLVHWSPLSTNLATDEVLEFIDSTATSRPRRFYRAVEVP